MTPQKSAPKILHTNLLQVLHKSASPFSNAAQCQTKTKEKVYQSHNPNRTIHSAMFGLTILSISHDPQHNIVTHTTLPLIRNFQL